MASVIDLDLMRAGRAPHKRRHTPTKDASAEIIIFPGIRYERWDDDDEPALKKKRGQ